MACKVSGGMTSRWSVADHEAVFDLTTLDGLSPTTPVRTLEETAFYGEFGSCHNIVINEETGFGLC